MADALFITPLFRDCVEKYSGIRERVKNKIRLISANPLGYGEPLKGRLAGFYSAPLVGNFIIIFLYCRNCRILGYNLIRKCLNCSTTSDDTVVFILFGPHDFAYKKANSYSELGDENTTPERPIE